MDSFKRIIDPPRPEDDFSDLYNTPLTDKEQVEFNNWAIEKAAVTGRDPRNDMYDYDVQGFWRSGAYKNTDPRGHGPDTFKKPNHTTFSNESIYHGKDGYEGGTWGDNSFTPSLTNLKWRTPTELYMYFKQKEPGTQLILPKGM